MAAWREFRLWYAASPSPHDLFAFKTAYLVPALEKHGVEDFLVLDEPRFVLLRLGADDELANDIRLSLEESIKSGALFAELTLETWSPEADARNRILSARQRAKLPAEIPEGGWVIKGKRSDGKWIADSEDLDKQVAAFSTFISRVLGRFTKAYLKEMPYRVEDRWLMSLFLHLMLNSISIDQPQESETREFPYF